MRIIFQFQASNKPKRFISSYHLFLQSLGNQVHYGILFKAFFHSAAVNREEMTQNKFRKKSLQMHFMPKSSKNFITGAI